MIVHQYVKDFENMGLGMFVHFGVYSVLGQGEWVMHQHKISREKYRSYAPTFNPESDWAEKLVLTAKSAALTKCRCCAARSMPVL